MCKHKKRSNNKRFARLIKIHKKKYLKEKSHLIVNIVKNLSHDETLGRIMNAYTQVNAKIEQLLIVHIIKCVEIVLDYIISSE